ncbi:MAG TPA: RsmE family RNA methyltransferase [Gemmatimonadaceae bacterium]|nr:RsmE family RNA methyltransferase [Gemmatimonadaceae bacterium]
MVEQRDRDALAAFFCPEPMEAGRTVILGEGEVQHARVRRIGIGERVRLLDGAGGVGFGTVVRLSKAQASIEIESIERVEPGPVIHLMVPIADRDRMLWVAEKATELAIFSWRPVLWKRSRSVSPRGEGVTFQAKARLRMLSALTQSGGAWLPVLYPDATPDRAIASAPAGARWLLDPDGEPMPSVSITAPLTIAVGPEGGVEPEERALLTGAGFLPVRIAPLTLRFETAAIAGLAIARAALLGTMEKSRV